MADSDLMTPDPVQPHLWNPNAAAAWSLIFTPVFGAYFCAANWRALGKPDRARSSMVWLWVTVVFLVVNLGTLFVPASQALDRIMQFASLGLLLAWLITQVRPQVRYVKEALGGRYIKKGWGLPLLAGVAGLGAYFAVILAIVAVLL
jgi:hypothetical protein